MRFENIKYYRHKKRGSVYVTAFSGILQSSGGPVPEGTELVIYSDRQGNTWLRPKAEFLDGRFEEITHREYHTPKTE